MVNTTTGLVELSNEVIGVSPKSRGSSTASLIATGLISGIFSDGGRQPREKVVVTNDQVRDVVQLAVDQAVTRIATEVDTHIATGGRGEEDKLASESIIAGRIIDLDGPSVVIDEIQRSLVRKGDRLFVRRARERKDPQTGKVTRYTVQVGEVEVVEVQDQVVIGSYSGPGTPQVGDIVTNSVSGAGMGAGSARSPQ